MAPRRALGLALQGHLSGWWHNPHHDRIGGVRAATPTAWVPQSKPIWFTELGCAAIDKGTNQPNKFLDPKSSESGLPYYSDGRRDDLIQMQYLRAHAAHLGRSGQQPGIRRSPARRWWTCLAAHVWAWDARPYPRFPGNRALWSDGGNYARGHWLNGRATARTLASVVAEICAAFGPARGRYLAPLRHRARLSPSPRSAMPAPRCNR